MNGGFWSGDQCKPLDLGVADHINGGELIARLHQREANNHVKQVKCILRCDERFVPVHNAGHMQKKGAGA